MRKKKHPEHVNHERWLVSYADFITLLFAFFVVMFAVSQVDSKRVGRFTEAFSKAVGINVFPLPGEGLLVGGPTPTGDPQENTTSQTSELDGLREALDRLSQTSGNLQGLQVFRRRNELVLRLPEGLLFDVGDARVNEGRAGMLKAIAPELISRPLEIRVEGYTDDRPISTGRYHSNWDLSTARATAVMVILAGQGLPPERLSIAGYGEFHPVVPNTSEDGRRQNRRVDLVVTAAVPEEPAAQ
jgi:chemotaxis protein MotB